MKYLTDYLYGTLAAPSRTFALLAARKPIGVSVLVLALVSLLAALGAFVDGSQQSAVLPYAAIPALAVLVVVLMFVAWFLRGAILHFLAQLMGGVGSAKGLLCILAFVELPGILIAPAALISRFAGDWFTLVAGLAVGIWGVVLAVLGVRANYGLSTGRSVLVVLLPAIATIVLIITFVVLVVVAMLPFMGNFMQNMPTGI